MTGSIALHVALDALLLSSVAGAICLIAALALSRRQFSGALRHLVLWCALIVAPASFAGFVALRPGPVGCLASSCGSGREASGPDVHYGLAAAGKFPGEPAPEVRSLRPASSTPWLPVLGTWLAGVILLLSRVARRRLALRRLFREASPVVDEDTIELAVRTARRLGLRRKPRFLHHPDVEHPTVGGALHPSVFLPEDFASAPRGTREMVLMHELSHVRRRDVTLSLAAEVAAALFWFNPLVWLAVRRASRVQEIAADSRVVDGGIRPSAYADYLLDCWRRMTGASSAAATLSIAGDCMLSERIRTVLDPETLHRSPAPLTTRLVGAGFAGLLALAVWTPAALQGAGLVTQEHLATRPKLQRSLLSAPALDSLLRPVIINRMTDRYVAGAAVAVVQGGRLVYAQGFGDREKYSEDPVDARHTIFRIGSITKVLTGIAVMQQVDRGAIDLDADVNDYLRDVHVPATFAEPVRVRNLLTHTAGFDQIGLDRHARSAEAVVPLGEWIGANLVRIRPPGDVSAYDTYGVTLAGHLVEQVSGTDYASYLRENIFAPLGMSRSGIDVPPALREDAAVGYGFAGEWEAMPWEYMNTAPASSVNATVTDMAHLAIMLLGDGEFEGRRVLSRQSVDAMLSRQFTNDPDQPGYGYLFFEDEWNGITTFSHGGSMEGFGAMLYLVPEYDLGIFIACNQESSAVIDPVIERLLGALFPTAHPKPLRHRYRGDIDLSRFTGTYANNMYHHGDPDTGWKRRPFELEATDEGALMFDGAPAWPVGPLTFQREDGLLLSFRENDEGEIAYLFVKQAAYEKLEPSTP